MSTEPPHPTGAQDLRAPDDRMYRPLHPSIVETLPDDFPDLKHEFSKLESQMFDRSKLNIILFVKLFNNINKLISSAG